MRLSAFGRDEMPAFRNINLHMSLFALTPAPATVRSRTHLLQPFLSAICISDSATAAHLNAISLQETVNLCHDVISASMSIMLFEIDVLIASIFGSA